MRIKEEKERTNFIDSKPFSPENQRKKKEKRKKKKEKEEMKKRKKN